MVGLGDRMPAAAPSAHTTVDHVFDIRDGTLDLRELASSGDMFFSSVWMMYLPSYACSRVVDLTTAAPIAADDVTVTARAQIIEVLAGDHAPVTDKHDPLQSKTFVEVTKDFRIQNATWLPDVCGVRVRARQ